MCASHTSTLGPQEGFPCLTVCTTASGRLFQMLFGTIQAIKRTKYSPNISIKVVTHKPQEAHLTKVYHCFCHMKQLRVLLLPLDGMLVHSRVTPQQYVAGTILSIHLGITERKPGVKFFSS